MHAQGLGHECTLSMLKSAEQHPLQNAFMYLHKQARAFSACLTEFKPVLRLVVNLVLAGFKIRGLHKGSITNHPRPAWGYQLFKDDNNP